MTGRVSATWSRLKYVSIFPRVHDIEVSLKWTSPSLFEPPRGQWNRKGYPSLITDVASIRALGGPTKIDSIQNTILMKSDLHDMWNNYEFGVNPDISSVGFLPLISRILFQSYRTIIALPHLLMGWMMCTD